MELTDPLPGVTDPGANEHVNVTGNPEQDKATASLSEPESGATLTVRLAAFSGVIVTDEGSVSSTKEEEEPGPPVPPDPVDPEPELPPLWQVRFACTPLEIRFVMLGFPIACT